MVKKRTGCSSNPFPSITHPPGWPSLNQEWNQIRKEKRGCNLNSPPPPHGPFWQMGRATNRYITQHHHEVRWRNVKGNNGSVLPILLFLPWIQTVLAKENPSTTWSSNDLHLVTLVSCRLVVSTEYEFRDECKSHLQLLFAPLWNLHQLGAPSGADYSMICIWCHI